MLAQPLEFPTMPHVTKSNSGTFWLPFPNPTMQFPSGLPNPTLDLTGLTGFCPSPLSSIWTHLAFNPYSPYQHLLPQSYYPFPVQHATPHNSYPWPLIIIPHGLLYLLSTFLYYSSNKALEIHMAQLLIMHCVSLSGYTLWTISPYRLSQTL